MAFDSLAERLQEAFKKLRGKGKLTENDIKEAYALSQKVAFPSLAVSSAGVPITMSVHGSVR